MPACEPKSLIILNYYNKVREISGAVGTRWLGAPFAARVVFSAASLAEGGRIDVADRSAAGRVLPATPFTSSHDQAGSRQVLLAIDDAFKQNGPVLGGRTPAFVPVAGIGSIQTACPKKY